MIEASMLRDTGIRAADRLGSVGLGLGALERPAPPGGGVLPPPSPPTSLPQSPFDRRDLVDIRGNLRPLAADSNVALGASDEEGGGAESSTGSGKRRKTAQPPQATFRPLLAAYGILTPALPLPVSSLQPAVPFPAGEGSQRARRLAEAFRTPEPEEDLGRFLDLAA